MPQLTTAETVVDPLLADAEDPEGRVAFLLGNEAIVRGALEADVGFACGYPGTPSSEVTDSFARVAGARGIEFEYSVNEKVALEMAFAASLAGARSICAMKHLGLMVAGDPLSTIPYIGVVGGMVIVSAGDPSCHTSPNEQDQRHLGPMLHLLTLDPSTPQEAYAMTRMAFALSEESRLPVLLRITTRVAHSRAAVRCGRLLEPGAATSGAEEEPRRSPRVKGFVRDPSRFVPIPANARRLRLEIKERLETARRLMAGLFRRTGGPAPKSGGNGVRQAILASGAPAATCADLLREHQLEDRVILASLGGVHPLPEAELVELLGEVDRVLVVEELSPFIEDAVRALCSRHGLSTEILGKRTGHLPEEFEYLPEVVRRGLHAGLGLGPPPVAAPEAPAAAPRPPVLCPGCPHRSTYFAVRTVFGDDGLYFNDIGCYTLGFGPPLDTADALVCMGAGLTLAAGVSRVTGERTVGFLGDSTFFHSGMPPLLNAIKEGVSMVAVILDNEVTAMTGFQESPTAGAGKKSHRVSIEGVVRALGAEHVETVDPADFAAAITAFERARDATGVSVIIAQHPCPIHVVKDTGVEPYGSVRYQIDPSRCRSCGREGCGLRCDQGVTRPFERQMARGRALEIIGDQTLAARDPACHDPVARDPVAPCAVQCPLGLCIQGYAAHIAAGQYRDALELIMSRNPLPDSVCRVCHRPCEEVCVRAGTDEPVAINDLKRFVVDWAANQEGSPYEPEREPSGGMKVAVVGAGPAGLAAAHDLRLRGYGVKLFDANDQPGGLLLTGIPAFRLPRQALQRDVDRILGLGVDFQGNTVLGRDLDLSELTEGYDAVFLGLGAQRPIALELPETGETGAGVPPATLDATPAETATVDALAYLASGGTADTGGSVVVVGGGNAAIDAARTALRRGAQSVAVAYRRSRAEMPALREEIEAAEQEGVELRTHLQPVAVKRGVDGGLVCVRTEPGERDADRRRRPVAVAGSEVLLAADLLIVAIGQTPDPGVTGDLRLATAADGSLEIDPETGRTSHPKIFAGGDQTGGARTVTDAIALGQRAAWGIDHTLRGPQAADRLAPPPRAGTWPQASADPRLVKRADRSPRQRPGEIPLEQRLAGFDEVAGVLSEARARAEAARCETCGQCANCRACLDLFGCPAFYLEDGLIRINTELCNGCGACADFCPNGAIRPVESAARRGGE